MEKILKDKLSKVLFHGTLLDRALDIQIHGFDFSKLNSRADFGKGFYLTDSYALAETTAKTRYYQTIQETGSSSAPTVLKVKINCRNLVDYKIKEFYGESIEWKRFICTNRWANQVLEFHPEYDNNIDAKYDIVLGLTADGKLGNFNRLLAQDGYELSAHVIQVLKPFTVAYYKPNNMSQKKITKAYQISLHNENFIKHCIKYKGCAIIEMDKEDGANE